MNDIKKLLDIALDEVGTKESPAGSNKTKYGKVYGLNGQPWCVIFLWWCFRQAGLSELFYGGGKCASCIRYINWAKSHGQWVTSGYKAGDLLFFDFGGDNVVDHIGICQSATTSGVVTVEGNTSLSGSQSNGGEVMNRTRPYKYIVGAARPLYKEDEMTGEEIYKKLNEYLASLPIPDWAKAEAAEAKAAGITDGTNPMCFTPRYQTAIMVKRGRK